MNTKTYSVQIDVDANGFSEALKTMFELRQELGLQLTINPLSTGEGAHILPANEASVSGDEVGKGVTVDAFDVLSIFDAACVEHCLKRLKVCVLSNEVVRH